MVKQESKDQHQKFFENWIKNLMNNMDTHLDEATRIEVMEECGRGCARGGALESAKKCQGNLDKFLVQMRTWIGKDNIKKDKNIVSVTYGKCYCELVRTGPPKLPDTYCHCSKGWLKEMFETVTGNPVNVTLIDSIKRGGEACRFTVKL